MVLVLVTLYSCKSDCGRWLEEGERGHEKHATVGGLSMVAFHVSSGPEQVSRSFMALHWTLETAQLLHCHDTSLNPAKRKAFLLTLLLQAEF